MNIQNVSLLATMLSDLGFETNCSSALLQRISFGPPQFEISQLVRKREDVVNYQICFQRKNDGYHFKYYDASLRKAIVLPTELEALDKRMAAIDWQVAFSCVENKIWSADDPASYKNEAMIHSIITELNALPSEENAARLKLKHWADINQEIFNLSSIRPKYEITQRFYFFEDQGCIGAEEAYRFLHNKWLEKQMIARRKTEASNEPPTETAGNKLLQKKRGNNKKRTLLS